MARKTPSRSQPKDLWKNQRGQVVVEYVLLLMVLAVIGSMATRMLVSRNPDNPGALITKWSQIIELIATDLPD